MNGAQFSTLPHVGQRTHARRLKRIGKNSPISQVGSVEAIAPLTKAETRAALETIAEVEIAWANYFDQLFGELEHAAHEEVARLEQKRRTPPNLRQLKYLREALKEFAYAREELGRPRSRGGPRAHEACYHTMQAVMLIRVTTIARVDKLTRGARLALAPINAKSTERAALWRERSVRAAAALPAARTERLRAARVIARLVKDFPREHVPNERTIRRYLSPLPLQTNK